MSRAPPCCARTFPFLHVVPRGTGLRLNPSSLMAPRRRAETPGSQGRGALRTLGCAGAALVPWHAAGHGGGWWSCCQCHLAACCRILLFPCSALGPPRRGHAPLHQLLRGVRGRGLLDLAPSLAEPSSASEETLSAAIWLPCAEGCPVGQAESTGPQQHLSLTPGRTDRQKLSLPSVSTFSQAPAPASSSWPPSVGFYT